MNAGTFFKAIISCGTAAALSGCYVVPIEPGYQPVYLHQPGQGVAGVPAPQPVSTALYGRLYPINDVAGRIGALTATASDNLNGHATFIINYGNDPLRGEASRVPDNYPGFGNVHRTVYGDGRMPTGQRGIASAAGAGGTFVNCEYALTATARGTGVCLFSNGAKYQIHFGG